jgi:hypothetical protein
MMRRCPLISGLLLVGVCLLTLEGCEALLELGWWPLRAELDEPFTLRVGQTAQLEELRVTFTRVLEDSRCPVDVVCVWAGNAKVELELLIVGGVRSTAVLNSTVEPREVGFAGYLLRYLDLKPYPKSTGPLDPRAYHLTLIISRERLEALQASWIP